MVTKLAASALTLFVLFLLTGWTTKVTPPQSSTSAELSGHVRYLASEELMGRAVGTAGIDLARNYIGEQFAKYGLLPGGDNGTYFQAVEAATGLKLKDASEVAVANARLAPDREWTALGFSASARVEGEMVFVGYGITATDYGYDDYAGMDVKGKIVVVLRYEPPPKDGGSPFRKHPQYSRYAELRTKAQTARGHGAAGMILVDLNSAEESEKGLLSLARTSSTSDAGIVSVQVSHRSLERALAGTGLSLRARKEKIDRDEKPASIPLGWKASLGIQIERITAKADNVIGILPGFESRAKDEHIVIGAHYDHIGLGHYGTRDTSAEGRIHHGADDNASGTAVLLWLAKELSRQPRRLPVAVIFVAFTGEELGLYGSRQYATRPALPLLSAKAMINLDMVGRLRNNRLMVAGAGTAKEFREILNHAELGLSLDVSPGVGRSDHVSFYNLNVPVLHFYTGVHEDYHRPTDTWEKLNFEGMEKVGRFVLHTATRVAGMSGPLTFSRVPPNAGRREELIPTSPPRAPNP
ncbi:MAG: M28 family peptidase [Deltaproteobacteria bacterium]|nr:M28 family peptidase [Deltaproteobacteria bacterium]